MYIGLNIGLNRPLSAEMTSMFVPDPVEFTLSIDPSGYSVVDGAADTLTVTVTSPPEYADGSPYTVDVSGIPGGPVLVTQPPITGQPETNTALTAPFPLYFFTGTDALTFQWERDTGAGWQDIPGATAEALPALLNDEAGDVRRKSTVVDDNGTRSFFTNFLAVAGGFNSIQDSLFSNGEAGFFYDTTRPENFYEAPDLSSNSPPIGANDIESIRDVSGNNWHADKNSGAGGYSSGPAWDGNDAAAVFNADTIQAALVPASLTASMTLMFAIRDAGNSNNNANILFGRSGTTSDWLLNFRSSAGSFYSGNMGTPTLFIDGVEQTSFPTGLLVNTLSDDAPHLIEIRNIDMTAEDWSYLNIGSRSINAVTGLRMYSPVLTSNATASDIENARQFWVENHGVVLT